MSAVTAIRIIATIERRELIKTAASEIRGIISMSIFPLSNRSQGPGDVTSKNATTACRVVLTEKTATPRSIKKTSNTKKPPRRTKLIESRLKNWMNWRRKIPYW
jgi:hypothetical protein